MATSFYSFQLIFSIYQHVSLTPFETVRDLDETLKGRLYAASALLSNSFPGAFFGLPNLSQCRLRVLGISGRDRRSVKHL